MPHRTPQATDAEDFLREIGQFEAPKNLGNFPDPDAPPATQRADASEEDPPPPSTGDQPAGDEPVGDRPAEEDERQEADEKGDPRVAALEARLEAQARELEFVRARAVAPAAPAAETDAVPTLPFRVSAADMQMIGLPPEAADMVQNALHAVGLWAIQQAQLRLRSEYGQVRTAETEATRLREAFYTANADLTPYVDLVGHYAQTVYAEHPTASADALMRETATRVRGRLKQLGVTPAPSGARPGRVGTKPRPAGAEMGRGRGNGATKLNEIERDILQLAQMR